VRGHFHNLSALSQGGAPCIHWIRGWVGSSDLSYFRDSIYDYFVVQPVEWSLHWQISCLISWRLNSRGNVWDITASRKFEGQMVNWKAYTAVARNTERERLLMKQFPTMWAIHIWFNTRYSNGMCWQRHYRWLHKTLLNSCWFPNSRLLCSDPKFSVHVLRIHV
jgi:hypothetical protein